MEEKCKLVSSRGILKSCSLRPLNPISSTNSVSLTAGSLNPGGSVYVCNDALEDFFTNYFHRIKIPFVLVSGDSDREIDQNLLSKKLLTEAVASNRLLAWFSQNLTASHPKLHHLPIGMDYHTASVPRNPFEPLPLSPAEQEATLLSIAREAKPFHERSDLVFVDFTPEPNKPDRALAINAFAPHSVKPIQKLSRTLIWKLYANFKYVLSPKGVGLDCHRTWEAIVLGCTPILKNSSLNYLYSDIRIFFVDDWKLPEKCYASFAFYKQNSELTGSRNLNKSLLLGYWNKKIRDAGKIELRNIKKA